ncbi:MAG: hypothetical protein J7K95_03595 [Thermoplasmata archaeon]|nr:hypothetical protein [Thermoplasmata archaeon]
MNEKRIHIFFDERLPVKELKCYWTYYGILIIDSEYYEECLNCILKIKNKWRIDKTLHFTDIGNNQDEINCCCCLLEMFKNKAFEEKCFFYLFGLDTQKIDTNLWEGSRATKKDKMFDKFFEISTWSALRWFFLYNDSKIEELVIEDFVAEERSRHYSGNFDSLISNVWLRNIGKGKNLIFEKKKICEISDDLDKSKDARSHFIQLVDLLIGSSCQLLDGLASIEGKNRIAREMYEPLKEVSQIIPKYNGDFFKKIGVGFFPKERRTKKQILNGNYGNQFYSNREFACERESFVGDLFN